MSGTRALGRPAVQRGSSRLGKHEPGAAQPISCNWPQPAPSAAHDPGSRLNYLFWGLSQVSYLNRGPGEDARATDLRVGSLARPATRDEMPQAGARWGVLRHPGWRAYLGGGGAPGRGSAKKHGIKGLKACPASRPRFGWHVSVRHEIFMTSSPSRDDGT